ncbi:MAG: hypothetical protein ACYDHH_16535 [Solirubrobacteraceae bacterium]
MSGAPEVPDWLREAIASAQRASEILQRSVGPQAIANAARVQISPEVIAKATRVQIPPEAIANATRAFEQYQAIGPSLQRALESIQTNWQIAERVEELRRQYAPENWHEILVSSSAEVLDDLDAALAQARGAKVDGHADACEFAGDAIAARDGHWAAAQALAASGLGQVIHGILGFPLFRGLGEARKKFTARDIDETTMTVLKVAVLEVCTLKSLTDIPDAQPQLFNRHGTQHGDRRFFSQSGALSGLLLLVGWVREFAWLSERRPDLFTGDGDVG